MFNAFLYSAVQYTSAINAVILQAGIPMLIFIFNFALFKMKASFAQVIGFTVTLIGVLITAAHAPHPPHRLYRGRLSERGAFRSFRAGLRAYGP